MPPKATPAVAEIDVRPYLEHASKKAREDEIGDGPEGNWEVAYVYAFIDRFTDLRKVEYSSTIKSVTDLELALVESSPPSKVPRRATLSAATRNSASEFNGNGNGNGNGQGHHSSASSLSSLSDDEDATPIPITPMPANPTISAIPPVLTPDTPIPPRSELLVTIVETFKQNLVGVPEMNDYHGKKTWLTWLINFVGKRLSDKFSGGFRWESNLLRTRGLKPGQEEDKMFWSLRWEDKIHLFRQLVDYQLCMSPPVRDKIQQGYDLGHQRNALRSPYTNPLIVESLGTTLTNRQIFHLDDSPRLYSATAIPSKSTQTVPPVHSNWATMSTTSAGYKAFLLSLPEPVVGLGQKKPKGGKGSKDDVKREERVIRSKLQKGLVKLAQFEEALAEIETKERRVAARRAESDARMARNLSRTHPGTSTRSTRQKPRTVTYVNDGIGEDDEIDQLEDDDDDDDHEQEDEDEDEDLAKMGRGKRRKIATNHAQHGEDDWDTSSVASGSNSRRQSHRGPVIPGERRSSRVQSRLKAEDGSQSGHADEIDELAEDEPDATEQRDGDMKVELSTDLVDENKQDDQPESNGQEQIENGDSTEDKPEDTMQV
ncbi:uncharacterized protein JCM15063_005320 [Sporobolomyces koalae]|uniref:uncharacterized protein n=1 Tax=Sporobolomyces koalae TaxID=500713 RepID=UPI0031803307